jgi:multidrug resistance efflux pump
MEKEKLPPIPTPVAQRWREFRIQILPLLVFCVVLVAIAFLWKSFVLPMGVIGSVETVQANVTSLQDGLLTTLLVDRFAHVTSNQPIAVVVKTDLDLIKATIAAVEAQLKFDGKRMEVDQIRNDQSYQQLHVNIFKEQVDRAIAIANLVQASNDFVRAGDLVKSNFFSAAQYDAAKAKFESLQVEVAERTKFIRNLNQTLDDLKKVVGGVDSDPIAEVIRAKEEELRLSLAPVTLKAPISGTISVVFHRAGEKIIRGEPIVTISDPGTSRIVGYVRQPIQVHPQRSDVVQVTTRTLPRQTGFGQVLEVGAQLEPITPALLSADTKRMEVGLPILVSIPQGMKLLPGEFVDLAFKKK